MNRGRNHGINKNLISEHLINSALQMDAKNTQYRTDGGSRIAPNAQYDTEAGAQRGIARQRERNFVHNSSRINQELRNFQLSLPESQQGLRRNPINFYESGVRVQRLRQWYHPHSEPELVISNRGG